MATVHYNVSFPDAKAHYAQIKITYKSTDDLSHFKVPVWTPGSYKVREFSQNYTVRSAVANGEELDVERVDKNSWKISHEVGVEITLVYDLYAFTVSTRQSYVDEFYAFLHGPSAFGYIHELKDEQIQLSVNPLSTWKNIEVALENEGERSFTALDYDLLADSPLAVGTFDVSHFESGGVPHRIVMIGEGNYNLDKVTADIKLICDQEVEMFGGHPSPMYVHFIQNTTAGSGGLEHLNSQTSDMYRWGYNDEKRYESFLGLIAHEYFHLWNVKRIRPEELGPFDYDKENYTSMLWIAEGITSYYDDLILLRSGLIDEDEYLNLVAKQITRYENTPGRYEMTLQESSKLAWIKAYLPNENSHNTTISYYNKGMLTAWMLDLLILENSKGELGLDDVMQALYNEYLKDPSKGFSYKHFIEICERISGKKLEAFFEQMVESTAPVRYEDYFGSFNIDLEIKESEGAWSGVHSSVQDGKIKIDRVTSHSPAVDCGLSVNDELISVNGWRLTTSLEEHVSKMKPGEVIELFISRDGKIISRTLVLAQDPNRSFTVKLGEQNKLQESWLK